MIKNKTLTILEFIQIVITASIVSSILFDIGYYYKLGLSLLSLPANITDFFYNSISWLPIIIPAVIIGVLIPLKENNDTKSTDVKTTNNKKKKTIMILSIFLISIFLIFGSLVIPVLAIVFVFIWSYIYSKYIFYDYGPFSKAVGMSLYIFPVIIVFILSIGYSRATVSVAETNPKNIIYYSNNSIDKNCTVLRSLSDGYIIKSSNKIAYINKSKVDKIEYIKKPTYFSGYLKEIKTFFNKINLS